MLIYNLFPTPVAKFSLGRAFTAKELKFVGSQKTRPNELNTASIDNYVFRQKTLAKLKEFSERCVDEYLKNVYAPKYQTSLQITQSWLNYTKPGQRHHKHAHPNSFVSGVLYIKADRTKDKIYFFKDGYQQLKLHTESFNTYNSDSWWFEAGEGDLLLFPSSLTHMVQTVEGEERVSLAFNTFPKGYVGHEDFLTALHLE